jgi:hypothetical protein
MMNKLGKKLADAKNPTEQQALLRTKMLAMLDTHAEIQEALHQILRKIDGVRREIDKYDRVTLVVLNPLNEITLLTTSAEAIGHHLDSPRTWHLKWAHEEQEGKPIRPLYNVLPIPEDRIIDIIHPAL